MRSTKSSSCGWKLRDMVTSEWQNTTSNAHQGHGLYRVPPLCFCGSCVSTFVLPKHHCTCLSILAGFLLRFRNEYHGSCKDAQKNSIRRAGLRLGSHRRARARRTRTGLRLGPGPESRVPCPSLRSQGPRCTKDASRP